MSTKSQFLDINFRMTEMKIKLTEWGILNYSPSPSNGELCRWAKTGQIHPSPERVGRHLMVDENAVRIPLCETVVVGKISSRALKILKTG